jgi:drug/metabolite transporter (DMT)-like permease
VTTQSSPIAAQETSRTQAKNRAYYALGVSIFSASISSSFVRMAQNEGMPTLTLVAGRLMLAFIILTPLVYANYRDQLRRLARRDWLISGFAGVWMAIQFMTFFGAIEFASIVVAQVIINTAPLWVALLERVVFKTNLSRIVWIGLIIALVGGGLIAAASLIEHDPAESDSQTTITVTSDPSDDNNDALLGAGLAFVAALAQTLYLTLGRKARTKVSALPYLWILIGSAMITTNFVLLVTGTSLIGYSTVAYFWLVVVTITAQILIHFGYNYALGYVSATMVSIYGQIISVGGGIAAFIFFTEIPTPLEIVGSFIILTGVTLSIIGRRPPTSAMNPPISNS